MYNGPHGFEHSEVLPLPHLIHTHSVFFFLCDAFIGNLEFWSEVILRIAESNKVFNANSFSNLFCRIGSVDLGFNQIVSTIGNPYIL